MSRLALFLALAPVVSHADPLQLFPDSKIVTSDRISVEVVGAGPDVVLIPGLASSRETWKATAERLRKDHRVHLVQVAGFAGEPPRGNATGAVVKPTIAAIDAYLVKAKLVRPAVIGHSLGGVMALSIALEHPQHVGKVFVVDALAFYSELAGGREVTVDNAKPFAQQIGERMTKASDFDYRASAKRAAATMASSAADQQRLVAWTMASTRAVTIKAMQEDMLLDLRPRVGELTVPLTVMYEAALAPLMEADYASAKHKTLVAAHKDVRHFVMWDEQAGFDHAVDAFLR